MGISLYSGNKLGFWDKWKRRVGDGAQSFFSHNVVWVDSCREEENVYDEVKCVQKGRAAGLNGATCFCLFWV